jgi:hypothetical protein
MTSQYKGVYFNKKSKKWISQRRIDGKTKYFGSFNTEIEAAIAFNLTLPKVFITLKKY